MSAESLHYLDLCFDLKFAELTDRHVTALTSPAFRGALGTRLRRMCCTANLPDCEPCPLKDYCAFPAFFAPIETARKPAHLARVNSMPRPFFLRAPGANDALDGELRLTLVGRAASQLPLVVAAIRDMGFGCTDQQIRYTVTGIRALTHGGWQAIGDGRPHLADPFMRFSDIARSLSGITVRKAVVSLLTPLQLAADGTLIDRINPQAFLQRMVERIESLNALYCDGPVNGRPWAADRAQTIRLGRSRVEMLEGATRSRRHGREVSVDGLVGNFELEGDLSPFAPYLACLPALGVGKKTTRGCGECDVQLY